LRQAGRSVELRPAPEARPAPSESQHSAAEGGTRDRVRPVGAVHVLRLRRQRQETASLYSGLYSGVSPNQGSSLTGGNVARGP